MLKSYGNTGTVHNMKPLDLTVYHGNGQVCVDCGRDLIQGLPVYRHRDAQNPHRRFYCISCVENPREVPYQSVPMRIVAPEVNIEPEPTVNPEVIQNLDPTIYVEPVVVPEVDLIRQVELMDRHRDKLIAVHNGASFKKEFGIRRGRVMKKNGIIKSFFVDEKRRWVVELTDIALRYLGIDYPAAPRPSKGTMPSRYKFERACDHNREELVVLHSGAALSCLAPGRRQKLRQLNVIGPSERLGTNWAAKLTDEAIEYLGLDAVEEPVRLEETPEPEIPELEKADHYLSPIEVLLTEELRDALSSIPICAQYLELIEEEGGPFRAEAAPIEDRVAAIEKMLVHITFTLHDAAVGVENYHAKKAPTKPLVKGWPV